MHALWVVFLFYYSVCVFAHAAGVFICNHAVATKACFG